MNNLEKEFLVSIQDCQKIIYKICHIYRNRKEDQEDLFQEIVYQLWKSYPSFNKLSKISTWIYRVALNTAISSYRKPRLSIEYVEVIPEYHSSGNISFSDNEEQLYEAIRILNDTEKAVISLYLEDFSYREIAEIMGMNENNVGVRLNRIKNKLIKIIK